MIGRGSWFGGPHDPSDSGHTASGGTTAEPGIAVYNHKTLGGYWRVKAPNGKTVVLKQTDIGPAPWTNRKVDVTYSALGQIGYSEHNFPTDGQFSAEYLGRDPAKAAQSNMRHQASQGTVTRQVSPGQTLFDSLGAGTAAQHAAGVRGVASLIGGRGVGDSALRSALEKVGAPPNPKDYESTTPPIFRTESTGLPQAAPGDLGQLATITHRANAIAAKHLPYLWGGGHQARIIHAEKATPLDCSGAVSAALGINPKVSGQFEKWGAPGKGSRMTIYANGHHVLMEIHGHFWGTSSTNPGGGAGWIRQGAISPQYLKGFTARHPLGDDQ